MRSPVKYSAWRPDPLPNHPINPGIAAVWICAVLFCAGFWIGVVLVAEKFL